MCCDEVGFILAREGRAGRAVCFIADDQIKLLKPVRFLRVRDDLDRLVGCEDNRHLIGVGVADTCGKFRGIRGRRKGQVQNIDLCDVIVAGAALTNLGIRTHSIRPKGRFSIARPFAHRLRHERQRGHEVKNGLA